MNFRSYVFLFFLRFVFEEVPVPSAFPQGAATRSLYFQTESRNECHIEPDWLLMYQIYEDTLILSAATTGRHADLFGE